MDSNEGFSGLMYFSCLIPVAVLIAERMVNLRSGVESSLFGNKRASTLYGEAGYYATPADQVNPTGSIRIPSLASAGSKEGSGYAVPVATGASQPSRTGSVRRAAGGGGPDISPPLPLLPTTQSQQGAYAVSSQIVVGASGAKSADVPPPNVPPPPVPSKETSASSSTSAVSVPPLPPRTAAGEYLLPDDPKPPVPEQPLPLADEPPAFTPRKPLTSPSRAPPPPPTASLPPIPTADQPLPQLPEDAPADGQLDDDEPIYDDVTDDDFEEGDEAAPRKPTDPDAESVGTVYEEVDGKRVRVKRKRKAAE